MSRLRLAVMRRARPGRAPARCASTGQRKREGKAPLGWIGVLLGIACFVSCGCSSITSGRWAVPAHCLKTQEYWKPESPKVPLDLTLLRQEAPATYRIGPGDTLAVYIHGLLPPSLEQAPVVQPATVSPSRYYPPVGVADLPALGLPLRVQDNGALLLPAVDPIVVEGLTIRQAYDRILAAYKAAGVLKADQVQMSVDLIKRRVYRVLVIREDVGADFPTLAAASQIPYTKRGRGAVIDLRRGENDVMHALAATGGLPGQDAKAEVWVLRSPQQKDLAQVATEVNEGANLEEVIQRVGPSRTIRIPLRVYPEETLDLSPADVVLNSGDILFVPERQEFFYSGGLLPGRQIPLPRDRDVDVIEAIAMAGGAVGGPLGAGGVYLPGKTGGYVFPPSRALVLRKLPCGQKLLIEVDLARAMHDPHERIKIVADDMVMLHFRPCELVGNMCLNWLSFGISATADIK